MATSELPDMTLVDQLPNLIEQVRAMGTSNHLDYVSKYNLTMLVYKVATLGDSIEQLPFDQRMNILKYLRIIMKKHGRNLNTAMHRNINSLIVAITRVSTKPAENNDATDFEDAQGSNEVPGSDYVSSKASKVAASTEKKLGHQNSASPKLKGLNESKQNVMRSKTRKPQKGKISTAKLANTSSSGEQNKGEKQFVDAVTTANFITNKEAENEKASGLEFKECIVYGSLARSNDKAMFTMPHSQRSTSRGDMFHVSLAECMSATEIFGERFAKREMVIPKNLSSLIFGCSEEVVAMVEILSNTIISFKPTEEGELWQRLAIAGRYKRDVDNTTCFIHLLLKYQIKMDFAQLTSLCCKFRQVDKQKRKQCMRKGTSCNSRKPLTDKSQVTMTLETAKGKQPAANAKPTVSCPETSKCQQGLKYKLDTVQMQLEIPNSSVGKIMGESGCIAAVIENLTKAIISFQRTGIAKEKRVLYLRARSWQDLNCAQELVTLTIERGINFGLLTDVLYWGNECLRSRSFQNLADNMSVLPNWEARKDKYYQNVWMPEGRQNIRQLLLKNDPHLKAPVEMSIKLHLPCTASAQRVRATTYPVRMQRKSFPSGSVKTKETKAKNLGFNLSKWKLLNLPNTEKETAENEKSETLAEQDKRQQHPNLTCNHDNAILALQRANFLMAALDTGSTSPLDRDCQLLCEALRINRETR
ncbi:hypothetical protein TTRE_0000181501 [Trichuris trichiura]|uniref:K Homology domain-containing protein n=1 Tax=Trichuris trichiura TaxID=36087 RepID=A0A077Z499_TRITR|nr:hypothetical protein TTRE_0000181501 [Trichuris trichiura]